MLRDEPLKYHTLVKIGGKADFLVWPETYEQVVEVIRLKEKHRLPFTLLGNGSNVIVRDGGIRGIVVQLKHLTEIKVEGEKLSRKAALILKQFLGLHWNTA